MFSLLPMTKVISMLAGLYALRMRPAIPPLQNDNNDVRRCAI